MKLAFMDSQLNPAERSGQGACTAFAGELHCSRHFRSKVCRFKRLICPTSSQYLQFSSKGYITVVQCYALPKSLIIRLPHFSRDERPIGFRNMLSWRKQFMRQLAVIG